MLKKALIASIACIVMVIAEGLAQQQPKDVQRVEQGLVQDQSGVYNILNMLFTKVAALEAKIMQEHVKSDVKKRMTKDEKALKKKMKKEKREEEKKDLEERLQEIEQRLEKVEKAIKEEQADD